MKHMSSHIKNKRKLAVRLCLSAMVFTLTFAATLQESDAQGRRRSRGDSQEQQKTTVGIEPGIVWHGSLKDGIKVAKETQRPIFLLSAAPSCTGVPGIW